MHVDENEKDKAGLALFGRLVGAVERVAGALATKWLAAAEKDRLQCVSLTKAIEAFEVFAPMAVALAGEKLGTKKESAPS